MTQYKNILKILQDLNISYDIIEHEASTSCEHSLELRQKAGLNLVGSKNIIFHAKGNFYLVTTLGNKDIKARKFKTEFKTKDIRFASQEEINYIGLGIIGSIAPFGFLNNEIPVFVDSEIFEKEFFIFNPADPCKSIRLKTTDLKKIYDNLNYKIKYFKITQDDIYFSHELI